MYHLDSNPKSLLAFFIVDAFANDLVGPVMEILERFPMRGTVIAYSLDVNARLSDVKPEIPTTSPGQTGTVSMRPP